MALQTVTRDLWLFLLTEGGEYTAAEIARRFDWTLNETIQRLNSMIRCGTVQRFPPEPGQRRLRYAVTGLCAVPSGMKVAEVQV